MKEISLSILGYEEYLEKNKSNIMEIIDAGVSFLHIDIMRRPFIKSNPRFAVESIRWIWKHFGSSATLDFHLMTKEPNVELSAINKIIPREKRGNIFITIPRESYSTSDKDSFDESDAKKNEKKITHSLSLIKRCGYKAGISLEPNTKIDLISDRMLEIIDLILIMTVSSGKGGQKYINGVNNKIKSARKMFPNIEVDGGINKNTLAISSASGATMFVIGSAITSQKNPALVTGEIVEYLNSHAPHG